MSAPKEPRRSRKPGGGIGIGVKLSVILAVFCVVILLVVWFMQIFMLDYFYERSKYRELGNAVLQIEDSITDENLGTLVSGLSARTQICFAVYTVENGTAHILASGEASPGCIIHKVTGEYLSRLYERALRSESGWFVEKIGKDETMPMREDGMLPPVEPESQNSVSDETETMQNPGLRDPNRPQNFRRGQNAVMVRAFTKNGTDYVILADSELTPVDATERTLQIQFLWIAAVVLLLGLILAFFLSRSISKPIRQMNESAKELASGRYSADFSVEGFREVRELSDSLNYAASELSKTDALQKELIANISHDLRTPLTLVKGYAEVVRDIHGEDVGQSMQVIIDETNRMTELVNDLLDLSKLKAGVRKLNPERFDLTALVREVMERYEKLTGHDGYSVSFEGTSEAYVTADRVMILQVVYNLINNAINYTGPDKTVRVSETVTDGSVRISVTDTGEGIPEDQLDQIWDRYYKVDKVHRRATVGTGLGLSIVKQILSEHNARFGIQTELGKGSTFWFELPLSPDEPSGN